MLHPVRARARAALIARALSILDGSSPNRRLVPVAHGATVVVLDYPANARNVPRWGHGRPRHAMLTARLEAERAAYRECLEVILRYGPELATIPRGHVDTLGTPCWENSYFGGLDAAALYGFIRDRAPATYLEVGSGNSTRFAARAKRDGGLATRIVSIDPDPRVSIDQLCDLVIRSPLECVEESVLHHFDELVHGDVVLIDGSHRVFMNNDAVVFWLDVLPRLTPGVLVGIHDIFLPEDYPPVVAHLHWSEQYLLAVALLHGSRVHPVLPSHFVCITPDLAEQLNRNFATIGLSGVHTYGSAFWFECRQDLETA